MNAKPLVLLVEDEPNWTDLILPVLSAPPPNVLDLYGIPGFEVHVATDGVAAEDLLSKAEQAGRPYDVVALDIQLPYRNGAVPSEQIGLQILESLTEEKCGAVVVESIEANVNNLARILRCGPNDFVPKPFSPEELLRAVIKAYLGCQERRWSELTKDHDQRWRLIQARAQVADRMAEVVTDGTAQMLDQIWELFRLLEGRYQLKADRDRNDPVCSALFGLKQAAITTSQKCSEVRSTAGFCAAKAEEIHLTDFVKQAADRLRAGLARSCLAFVEPADGNPPVRTVAHDVSRVVEEMLFFAIEGSRRGGTVRSDIRVDEAGTACLQVADQGEPLPEDLRAKISRGEPLAPEHGRGWGLSLAQRVAQYVLGGRIEVQAGHGGNVVTLQLPL